MIRMIRDVKALPDELSDPSAGPQGCRIAERLRATQDPPDQGAALWGGVSFVGWPDAS